VYVYVYVYMCVYVYVYVCMCVFSFARALARVYTTFSSEPTHCAAFGRECSRGRRWGGCCSRGTGQ